MSIKGKGGLNQKIKNIEKKNESFGGVEILFWFVVAIGAAFMVYVLVF